MHLSSDIKSTPPLLTLEEMIFKAICTAERIGGKIKAENLQKHFRLK